ncbi:aminodeoxychorismate/anthranilate synthase component II [Candidatus Vidania fulgoroideorum]
MKNILIIDHYDSFTYNVYEIFGNLKLKTNVLKFNKLNSNIIKIIFYKPLIIIGPGPGEPKEYIKTFKILKVFYKFLNFIGICLGHQIIGIFFGFFLKKSKKIIHGKICTLKIFNYLKNMPKKINAVRYNSLTIFKKKKIKTKILSVEKKTKEIMIIFNKKFKFISFQFHIESFGSIKGKKILKKCINEIFN